MQDIFIQKLALLRSAWERRWIGAAAAWALFVVGAVAVAFVPERYEASAKVFVNTQSVLKPLIEGIAVQPNIDQQLAMLGKTLISRPTMEQLISDPTLDLQPAHGESKDAYVDGLIRRIKITSSGRENLYDLTFRDQNPARAQRFVQSLVTLFVQTGIGGKKADTDEARQFIDEQIKSYEEKLTAAENKVKDFKLRNLGVVGTGNLDHFARMNSAQEDLDKLVFDLRAAEQSRDALKRQLAQEESSLTAAADSALQASNASVPEIDQRIDAQKRQLDDLLRRFTEDHPDVVSARRTIAQLERQKRDELAARVRDAKSGNRAALGSDPVTQKIRISLADAEANVAALRARVGDRQALLAQLRATAGKVPQAEAELAQLNRDYEIIRKNYDALVARRESAAIGVAVDATSQLAEFRVVEPPHVGQSPVFPNRKMLVLALLFASLAGGTAVALVVAQAHPTFHSLRSLRELTKRPVLGTVSFVMGEQQALVERKQRMQFIGVIGVLVAFHFAWLVWLSFGAGK